MRAGPCRGRCHRAGQNADPPRLDAARAAGQGAGPVMASRGLLNWTAGWRRPPCPGWAWARALPWQLQHWVSAVMGAGASPLFQPFACRHKMVFTASCRTAMQVTAACRQACVACSCDTRTTPRLRPPPRPEHRALRTGTGPVVHQRPLARSAAVLAAPRFETDHRAQRTGSNSKMGLHLGQEDLLALDATDQPHHLLAHVSASCWDLSSHSLWELARAAGCGASLIACGPVQPTTTKDMPWLPQGTDNLSWWMRHSPAPGGGHRRPADPGRCAGGGSLPPRGGLCRARTGAGPAEHAGPGPSLAASMADRPACRTVGASAPAPPLPAHASRPDTGGPRPHPPDNP
jgi:hydroxymethylpyrimidine kinase/phosphomethylpyrimidine kinase/thiamine-phosphate diphosphorylase